MEKKITMVLGLALLCAALVLHSQYPVYRPQDAVCGSSGTPTPTETVDGSSETPTPTETVDGSSGTPTPTETVCGSSETPTPTETAEDADEAEKIAEAVADSVGTEAELATLGYDYDYVLRVVTHEANRDYALCRAVATAIHNGCVRCDGLYAPDELCRAYHYAEPSDFISGAAREACEAVLIRGELCEEIGDATVFYNPAMCTPRYHTSEHCEAVCTVSGVVFCRELD